MEQAIDFELRKIHKGFFESLGSYYFDLIAPDHPDPIASTKVTSMQRGVPSTVTITSTGNEYLTAGEYHVGPRASGYQQINLPRHFYPLVTLISPASRESPLPPGKLGSLFYIANVDSYFAIQGPDRQTILAEIHPAWKDADCNRGVVQFITLYPTPPDQNRELILLAAICRAAGISLT